MAGGRVLWRDTLKIIALLVLFVAFPALVTAQDCPCQLDNSELYPRMYRWDCSNLSLTSVPGMCFSIRTVNVSEFILSYNEVTDIRSTDLAELTDLRVLRLDNNLINFVDPTAFEFMHDLQVFDVNHNLQMTLDDDVFSGLYNLEEITTIGTAMKNLPNVSMSPALNVLDVRSSQLTQLPLDGLLNPSLTSASFYLNTDGNEFTDVAASTLIELPDDTILNMDLFVTIWAVDANEKQEIVTKPWTGNVELASRTKICGEDGHPDDKTICPETDNGIYF